MKSIVLSIMIASVSATFAQTGDMPTHQLKNKFSAKQRMAVKPATMDLKETAQKTDNSESAVLSLSEGKSAIMNGVIRVQKGTPYVVLKTDGVERRMIPTNLPKEMAIDGREIQFRYTEAESKMQKGSDSPMVIDIYDVSMSPKK